MYNITVYGGGLAGAGGRGCGGGGAWTPAWAVMQDTHRVPHWLDKA